MLELLVWGALIVLGGYGGFGRASNVIRPDGLVVPTAQLLTVLAIGLPPSGHPPEAIVEI